MKNLSIDSSEANVIHAALLNRREVMRDAIKYSAEENKLSNVQRYLDEITLIDILIKKLKEL